MSSRSIFHKTCPECAAQVPVANESCDCGHRFVASIATNAEELPGQDEDLFRAYLQARIGQAVTALEYERARLSIDPKDFDQAYRVMRALHDVQTLRAELNVQGGNAVEPAAAAAGGSKRPTEAFRSAQAAKASKAMEVFEGTSTKQCPKCHQILPISTVLCLCGFAFRHDREPRQPALDREQAVTADHRLENPPRT
ncbi:MAG: hypothetical protein JSW09_02745 [Pseudomonadota bacterium]|nr:MAG: hypothetical protein JSW09_02745 [Pseudomonadota bacterium]